MSVCIASAPNLTRLHNSDMTRTANITLLTESKSQVKLLPVLDASIYKFGSKDYIGQCLTSHIDHITDQKHKNK